MTDRSYPGFAYRHTEVDGVNNDEQYFQKIEEQLETVDHKLAELQIQSEHTNADAQQSTNERWRDLEIQRNNVRTSVKYLRESNVVLVEDLRLGIEKAVADLRHAVEVALSESAK